MTQLTQNPIAEFEHILQKHIEGDRKPLIFRIPNQFLDDDLMPVCQMINQQIDANPRADSVIIIEVDVTPETAEAVSRDTIQRLTDTFKRLDGTPRQDSERHEHYVYCLATELYDRLMARLNWEAPAQYMPILN